MSWMDVIYIPIGKEPYLCDHRLYALYPRRRELENTIAGYLNSTLFYLTVELYCRRLGGGATDIMVEDYEEMPVPALFQLRIDFDLNRLLKRRPLKYNEEVGQQDRRELDRAVLLALGFPKEKVEQLLNDLYQAFLEVVEDRLIKAREPTGVPVWQK